VNTAIMNKMAMPYIAVSTNELYQELANWNAINDAYARNNLLEL
jgi:hypothetical protein